MSIIMDWFNTWVKRYDESVTEHVTKGPGEYKEEENLSFGPGSTGEGLVTTALKQVTRIALIIIVGLIGILALFQLLPVEVRRWR